MDADAIKDRLKNLHGAIDHNHPGGARAVVVEGGTSLVIPDGLDLSEAQVDYLAGLGKHYGSRRAVPLTS